MSLSQASPRPLFTLRAGLLASLIGTLIFTAFWTYAQSLYYGDGPVDVDDWEGWGNLTLQVALPAFIITLFHALPPWLLWSLGGFLRRLSGGTPGPRHGASGVWSFVLVAGAVVAIWYFLTLEQIGGKSAPILWGVLVVHSLATFLPALLLVAWWGLRKATNRSRRIRT